MPSIDAPGDPFGSQADMIPTESSPIPDTTIPDTRPAETKEKGELTLKRKGFPMRLSSVRAAQAEDPEREKRPIKLIAPIYNGLGVAITICAYRPWF